MWHVVQITHPMQAFIKAGIILNILLEFNGTEYIYNGLIWVIKYTQSRSSVTQEKPYIVSTTNVYTNPAQPKVNAWSV